MACTSFATGTSMGTMAIMSVICLPMAINMGVNIELVAGAIFGGSIFWRPTLPDIRHDHNILRDLPALNHHRPCKDPDSLRCDMRGCVDRTVYGARIRDVRLKKIKNSTYNSFRRVYLRGSYFYFTGICLKSLTCHGFNDKIHCLNM